MQVAFEVRYWHLTDEQRAAWDRDSGDSDDPTEGCELVTVNRFEDRAFAERKAQEVSLTDNPTCHVAMLEIEDGEVVNEDVISCFRNGAPASPVEEERMRA